jgi:hypothetical protein
MIGSSGVVTFKPLDALVDLLGHLLVGALRVVVALVGLLAIAML